MANFEKRSSANYRLYKDGDTAPGSSVAAADLTDNAAAVEWAKDWVEVHGDHDLYTVERRDGRFAANLIRTVGGQLYAMPKIGFLVVD